MTLQQLEYIVAVDKYRHFVKAAEACGVTQSTLSSLVQKLEAELDMTIFDRTSHPVCPTQGGQHVISQAKVILYNASQLKELVLTDRTAECGEVRMGVIPTVAPYILPSFFKTMHENHSCVNLQVVEARTSAIISQLERAELDMAILTTPLENNDLLEIPVYYEKFYAYVSPTEKLYSKDEIEMSEMPSKHLWLLQEGHCLRNQVMTICKHKSEYSTVYEAGSIDTLVKIVDINGGYTIIPELHIPQLDAERQKRVRKFVDPEPVREISLVVRKDFVRERLLNVIANAIKENIPEHMIDKRLKKFTIKL